MEKLTDLIDLIPEYKIDEILDWLRRVEDWDLEAAVEASMILNMVKDDIEELREEIRELREITKE